VSVKSIEEMGAYVILLEYIVGMTSSAFKSANDVLFVMYSVLF